MPMNFIEFFETATTQMSSLVTAFLSLLTVASGIWLALLAWRLYKDITNNVVTDLDGNAVDGAHWSDDGIEYDGMTFEDEGDLSDYVHWTDEDEQGYQDYISS